MIAFLLLATLAFAQPVEAPCTAEARAWVAALELELVGCPGPEQLVVRVAAEQPLDVELGRGDGPAMLVVEDVRIAPVANVPDWDAAPEAWQAGVEAIRVAVSAGLPSPLGAERIEAVREAPLRPWPWRLAGLLLVPFFVRRRGWTAWALFGGAAALRLLLGPWSVHHTNGLGPFWLRGAILDPATLAEYGAGYPELFSLAVRLLPSQPDLAVFGFNAVIAAGLAPCAFVLARELGAGGRAALGVGLLVALDPVCIRFGATESYVPALALGVGGAAWLAVLAARDRGARALALGLVAALVAAQTARVHPAVWPALLLVPLAVVRIGGARRAVGIALAIAAAVLLPAPGEFFEVLEAVAARRAEGGLLESRVLGGAGLRAWLLAAGIAGYAIWVEPRARRVATVLIGAVLLLAATQSIYGQSELWQASYRRIFTIPLAVGLAVLLPLRLPRWSLLAALLVFALGWSTVHERTTEQLEYRWLRSRLQAADPELLVLVPDFVGPRQVLVADYLLARPGNLRKVRDSKQVAELRERGPVLGIWTSLCSGPDSAARCAPLQGFEQLEATELPAAQSFTRLPYARDPVVVRWLRAGAQ